MRGLGRPAKVFFAVNFAFSLGMGLYSFVMPAYARQLGASPAQFGAMISLASALGVLVVIPGGFWADRYDQRLLMVISWGLCLPIPLIFAVAPTWAWLVPGYALLFLSFFCNPAISAYIARCAKPDQLGAVWGRINSAFPLGFIIGPSLGSLIIRSFGMPVVFLATFACYTTSFGLLFLLPRNPEPQVASHAAQSAPASQPLGERSPEPVAYTPGRASSRSLVPVFLVFAVFTMLATLGQNYVSLFLQDTSGLDLGSLGWFGSAGSIGGFFLAPALGRLRDKRGGALALPIGLVLSAAAYGSLLILRQPVMLFLALIMRGGESSVFSLSGPEVSQRAPRDNLGRVFASFQVLTGIGNTVGPYLGGLMYGIDNRLPFLTVVIGSLLLAAVGRRILRQPAATPTVPALDAAPTLAGSEEGAGA